MTSELIDDTKVAGSIDLFTAWVESQMAYSQLPGLSAAVVYDQELVWAKGFGYANGTKKIPTSSTSIYRIASITKLFSATALLQLRDAGLLQLDDPVTKHLPWFEIQHQYPLAPAITIRHLLTHTSGLPREAAFAYWSDSNFPTQDQIKATVSQQKTIFPTETEWKYSNLALTLAGEIVAAVSGQAYADYIKSKILEPLNMRSTYVNTIDPDHPDLATGYSRRLPAAGRRQSPFTDCKGITPAANMSSTAEDLARFVMLQFRTGSDEMPLPAGGAQILRSASLLEMQRIHWLKPDWRSGWGLGFGIERRKNKTYIGHGGAVKGYRTTIQMCPADKIGVIVLTNGDDGNPLGYVMKAFEWIAPAIVEAAAPREADPIPQFDARLYVGKYRNDWEDTQVLFLNNELVTINPALVDPVSTMGKLVPVGKHTFRLRAKNGLDESGELAVFELDDEGRVIHLKVGENYTFPIAAW